VKKREEGGLKPAPRLASLPADVSLTSLFAALGSELGRSRDINVIAIGANEVPSPTISGTLGAGTTSDILVRKARLTVAGTRLDRQGKDGQGNDEGVGEGFHNAEGKKEENG
jgi:hypothetical protein